MASAARPERLARGGGDRVPVETVPTSSRPRSVWDMRTTPWPSLRSSSSSSNDPQTVSADKPEVLFLCVHNAGRSQMAAAFLRQIGLGRVTVHSAGSEPAEALNPAVVAALAEAGLDISAERPKLLVEEMATDAADVIVTMGCGDTCPVYPGKRYLDWELPDPAGRPIEEVRPIHDEIERRVQALVAEIAPKRPHSE